MSKLPSFRLSNEGPNRQAFAVHFGRLEDRNAPRIRYPFLSWGLAAINLRYPCLSAPTYPTPSADLTGMIMDQNQHFCDRKERMTPHNLLQGAADAWHHAPSHQAEHCLQGFLGGFVHWTVPSRPPNGMHHVRGALNSWGTTPVQDSAESKAARHLDSPPTEVLST